MGLQMSLMPYYGASGKSCDFRELIFTVRCFILFLKRYNKELKMENDFASCILIIVIILYGMKVVINKYPNMTVAVLVFYAGYGIGSLIDYYAHIDVFKWIIGFLLAWKGRAPVIRFFRRRRIITRADQIKYGNMKGRK